MDSIKEFICYEAVDLPREYALDILKLVKRHSPNAIQKFPDGTRINLDKLPDNINRQIYEYIKHKASSCE
jgi:hypothetical protein